ITILVSTPYMDEASLCDRIALIQNGQFLKIDTPENIVGQFADTLWAAKSDNMHKLLEDLRNDEEVKSSFAFGDSIHVTVENGQLTVDSLKKYLIERGHNKIEIQPIEPTIEDCFMELSNTQI
ncbi:MAG: ABC transporter ATP-binding protein, partial [Paludibacter sp.]|nr:ABC transporter ATP-binding protein [Paludibacter sp.]